ncbi:Rho Gtpase-Activating Protein 15 [Manis pentadactyla]|nr:Rho Gtpase-Activating Protein 15 [Manis pentadactyla]
MESNVGQMTISPISRSTGLESRVSTSVAALQWKHGSYHSIEEERLVQSCPARNLKRSPGEEVSAYEVLLKYFKIIQSNFTGLGDQPKGSEVDT